MKKILVASTALVAAGMMSAGAASASEKIKLELGGYSKWWVVGAWQDQSYQHESQTDYNSVDIKGDNEIWFDGSTKLDNGLTVGVHVELEAGGNVDTTSSGSNVIDKSYSYLESGFGKIIVGNNDNGTVLLHVMAPDAAGNTGTDGILTGGYAIAAPSGFVTRGTTEIDTDGVAEKLTYVSPSFYGLTVGGSYIPNTKAKDRGAVDLDTTGGELYGVGAGYAREFNGVGVKASAGYVLGDAGTNNRKWTEWSAGTQVSYAGFTLGGSYRHAADSEGLNTISGDGSVWDAGLSYENGPYAVSFIYFQSKAEDSIALAADDKFSVYQVSGKYALGAGVDALATVGHAKYDSENGAQSSNNEGWAVMTGLSLTF